MKPKIMRAAVLGAGVMGSTIAAQLANVGIPTYLFDIVPRELTPKEEGKGLTLENPAVRNRLANDSLKMLTKMRPAALYDTDNVNLITPGNFEDHLHYLKDVDWIIEVIVERLDIKKGLLAKVAENIKPGTIVSSNTSGISINKMVEDLPVEFRNYFLGTHFFNPPRYMKLLELIPCKETLPEVMEFIDEFGTKVLGKGVVIAKDTPNFIANRIGTYGMMVTAKTMLEDDLTVEEIDAITGRPMGRPKSASFRTLDMVGLDIFLHVAENVYSNVDDEKEKEEFTPPEFLNKMVEKGLLGAKVRKGFYQKVKKDGKSEILSLDVNTLEYTPRKKASFGSLTNAKNAPGLKNRIKAIIYGDDKAASFAWKVVKKTLLYSADKASDIADSIKAIDDAMRWGFGWDLGPFELWDVMGLKKSVERMRNENEEIPAWIEKMLEDGKETFYSVEDGQKSYYDFKTGDYVGLEQVAEIILLPSLKDRDKVIKSNAGADLIDMGDGVACLEFHSRSNAIGADIVEMIHESIEEVEKNYLGMVIGNHGKNFSVGANLMLILMEAEDENWDILDNMVSEFQNAGMALKYCNKPVVAAPFNMTLGGGCEYCMASDKIQASAETYMGLVEVGVGVIPAGGGTKEMLYRAMAQMPREGLTQTRYNYNPVPAVARAFEIVAMAKVSTSAAEAIRLGYMKTTDGVTVNKDLLLHDAKQAVLGIANQGYRAPITEKIKVTGDQGFADLDIMIYTLKEGKYISDHDVKISRKVAKVLTGGDVSFDTYVTEQYLLDLEREAFLSLLGEPLTQDRIRHMLSTGKPLRN
ncbi:MAG TPA: 3-hydroxyacyl-CoA dehydrogenase NAD-binding domain-containing protein [Clostridia bacterium]|nr:3-hydroxyacyl-CoA dehydrogenase NAD-binding domain-containing protein [Clostridia bacterium]